MHKYGMSNGVTVCAVCQDNDRGDCPDHPHIDPNDSLGNLLYDIESEVFRARLLFPSCEGVAMAMLEEVGEVATACLEGPRAHIRKEAVQACAMLIRLALEGDPSLAKLRTTRGLDR